MAGSSPAMTTEGVVTGVAVSEAADGWGRSEARPDLLWTIQRSHV